MKFTSVEFLLLKWHKQWQQDKISPSLFGFSLPCFHFLLLWWFFTRKDRGMLKSLWRTGECRRRLSVWQRWEGSSGSCWTQTAERLTACSFASSFADGLWSRVRLRSRRGISIDTSLEPITTKGQVQGAGPACQLAAHQQNRCMKERRRSGGGGGDFSAQSRHFSQARAHDHFRRDSQAPPVFVYYICPKTRIALKSSKDIRVLMVKTCWKLGERNYSPSGQCFIHSIHNFLLIRHSSPCSIQYMHTKIK